MSSTNLNRSRSGHSLREGSSPSTAATGGGVTAQDASVPISSLLPIQPAIVLDIGTSTIKIGIAGESVIRCVIPTPDGLQYLLLNPKNSAGLNVRSEVIAAVELISTKLCAPSLSPVLVAPSAGSGGGSNSGSGMLIRKGSSRHFGSMRGGGLARTNSMSRMVSQSAAASKNSKPPRVVLLTNANANLAVRRLLVTEIKRRVGVPTSAPKASDEAPLQMPESPNRDRPRSKSVDRNESNPLDEAESQLAQRPVQAVCAQVSALAAYGPGFRRTQVPLRGTKVTVGHLSSLSGLVVDAGFSGTRVVPIVHQSVACGGEITTGTTSSSAIGGNYGCVGVAAKSGIKVIIDTLRAQIIRDNTAVFTKNRISDIQLRPPPPHAPSSTVCLLSDELLTDVLLQYGVVAPPPGHPAREATLNASYPVIIKTFFVSAKPNMAIEKCLFFPCMFALEKWASTTRTTPAPAAPAPTPSTDGAAPPATAPQAPPPKPAPLTHIEELEVLTLKGLNPGDEAMPLPDAILDWWLSKETSAELRTLWISTLSSHSSVPRATLCALAACHPWLELPLVTGNFRGAIPSSNTNVSSCREGGAPLLMCGAASHIPFFIERATVALSAACQRVLTEASTHWSTRTTTTAANVLPFLAKCDIDFGGTNPTAVRGWDQSSSSVVLQMWPDSNKSSSTQIDSWHAMGQQLATSFLYMQVMGSGAVSHREEEEAGGNKDLHNTIKKLSINPQMMGAMALFAA